MKTTTLRAVIAEVVRDNPEVRNTTALIDTLEAALKPLMVEIDPGGCAPAVLVPAFAEKRQ